MVEGRRKDWREDETLEAAARRLLAEWDERIARKKAAERLKASEKFSDQPARSLAMAEKADGASDGVIGSLKRRPQRTAEGGDFSSERVAQEVGHRGNAMGNCGGRAACMGSEPLGETNGCARPDRPEGAIGSKERTDSHALEDW